MLRPSRLPAAVLALSLLQSLAAAATTPLPPDPALESRGAVIGEVVVRVGDVFDPSDPQEDRRAFRVVNRLHRNTREGVIRNQLLFKSGDRYSRRTLEESERLLRKDRYLYDVQIRPLRYDGNRVDVEVVTRDVWTLNAGVGLGRSGGENSVHVDLQDTNLLGLGKSLTLRRSSNVDRTESLIRYDDPAVLGSRFQLNLGFSDNSDGRRQEIRFGQPFYSLESRWSAHVSALSDDRTDTLYRLGHVSGGFQHQEERFELHGGLSRGLVDGRVQRWTAGFAWQRDRYSLLDGFAAPPDLPEERVLAYPWVAWDRVEDGYAEATNLDQIRRTEDLQLGSQLHLRLGWATSNAAIFDAAASTGWKPSPNQTLLLSSDLTGRCGGDGAEDLLLEGGARYYWRDFGEHLFFATLEGGLARNLDPGKQLLLGGDSGLRGYPLRYQDGDARVLLTLEQRFFTGFYPFHLVHVGGAVFFDAGRTWGGADNLGLLKDVGFGLRLSSSRSGLGSMIHLDLAFPLDGDPSIQSMQWLVSTKTSF
jgi:outer membrane protein assembly factor BamA